MKRIALSLMTIATVAIMATGATSAYFSDNATSFNNTFSAGTLDLKIANVDTSWGNNVSGTWVSPANWAPGQEFSSSIYLKNAGTIPAEAIYTHWNNLRDPKGLSNVIQITGMWDSTDMSVGGNSVEVFRAFYDANGDGKLSLAELVNGRSFNNTSTKTPAPYQARYYADYNESYEHAVLPANGTFEIKFSFKFMESAGNQYQGAQAQVDLTLLAAQHHYVSGEPF